MINCFIIARLSSKRLPKKNILSFNNKPMIVNLYNRIIKSKFINDVIICTSNEESDDPLFEISKEFNINIFRGSLNDIMNRICEAANNFKTDHIVEILGDNPLVDSELVDDVINLYIENNLDYTSNISLDYQKANSIKKYKCFPIGVRVQIYRYEIALQYKKFKNTKFLSSHPTNYIFENENIFKINFLEAKNDYNFLNLPEYNFAVNENEQFKNIKMIFDYFNENDFSLKEAIDYLKNENKLKSFK